MCVVEKCEECISNGLYPVNFSADGQVQSTNTTPADNCDHFFQWFLQSKFTST